MMRKSIPTIKINIPLSTYCPYWLTIPCNPVSVVAVVVVVVVCMACWSFSLGVVLNQGPVLVFAGVYGFPNKKFLIWVVPHIICMHDVLSFPRAAFVNCEIFSRLAGFFSYLFWISCSHTPNSMMKWLNNKCFVARSRLKGADYYLLLLVPCDLRLSFNYSQKWFFVQKKSFCSRGKQAYAT